MRTIAAACGVGPSRSRVALTALVCCSMWIAACGSDDSAADPAADRSDAVSTGSPAPSDAAGEPSTTDDGTAADGPNTTAATADTTTTAATTAATTVVPTAAVESVTTAEPTTTDEATTTAEPATADAGTFITEPTPAAMCPEGTWPRAAAYEIDTGAFQWASCTDDRAWLSVIHADGDAVHLWLPTIDPDATVALDPQTGEELPSAPPPPTEAFGDRTGEPIVTERDGAQVTGGQDDPVRVVLPDGTTWSQPGRWAYDNVFAIGDGAVFAVERAGPNSRLVGYELQTGDVRWAHEGDAPSEGLWPWAIADGRLYTLWSNLQIRSTADGTLVWATAYPAPEDPFVPPSPDAPRMSGVAIGEDLVYVSFATEASGGD